MLSIIARRAVKRRRRIKDMFCILSSRPVWFSLLITLVLPHATAEDHQTRIRLDVLEPADRSTVTCGGALPFPNFAFEPWNLIGMKLHFLAYYYHLTGYRRAKDVMEEIIQGAIQFTRDFNEQLGPDRLVGGRENYNMNRFWATAYQETHDPEIETFARQSRAVAISREYDGAALTFGRPKVYLFEGHHRRVGKYVSFVSTDIHGSTRRGSAGGG